MYKYFLSIIFSTRLTIVLFLVFAIAMATGTFLDASETVAPSAYTNRLIYRAWWFEGIMFLMAVNFLGQIVKYRLLRKAKWATLLLHMAFIFILAGAAITRYVGYEGTMHIREAETSNTFYSSETYLTGFVQDTSAQTNKEPRQHIEPRQLLLSERATNRDRINTYYGEQKIQIEIENFITGATKVFVEDENGVEFLKIVEAKGGKQVDHWLKEGDRLELKGKLITLNAPVKGAINISSRQNAEPVISSPWGGTTFGMADQKKDTLFKDSIQPLRTKALYQFGGLIFAVPEKITKGRYELQKIKKTDSGTKDGVTVKVSSKGESKIVHLLGQKGVAPNMESVHVGGVKITLGYGAIVRKLPFGIRLNDFIAEKYPGTTTGYSAFISKISVFDPEGRNFDQEIYMNHVLDYKGYRFFQSSFHPDEKGTILSVNHDFWGTWTTYLGYFMLYLGLCGILFGKSTRIFHLNKQIKRSKRKRVVLTSLIFACFSFLSYGQDSNDEIYKKVDAAIMAGKINRQHAAKFGGLVLQDNGRMKPVNTFASEILRKIHRKSSYKELDANQTFLSMLQYPRLWLEVPLIPLKRGNDSIRKIIGIPETTKYVSLITMVDQNGNYKLKPYLDEATRTTNPNKFQKDIRKVHESFYLLNEVLQGNNFRIFPIPQDPNSKWVSYAELSDHKFQGRDSLYVHKILPLYFQKINEAKQSGNYEQVNELLVSIHDFQKRYGASVRPSERKISAELLYNKADIFNRAYSYLFLLGAMLLILTIIQVFKESKALSLGLGLLKLLALLVFILITLGLVLRWYVSGHAPWSNAYESVIYVGWATMFFGLALGRSNHLVISATLFMSAIILWVAHENWLDPAIANLQPVLDSYWLMIHVAIIVASYGPLTLGMILGSISLFLMILLNNNNRNRINSQIGELTAITEMVLIVGTAMLTVGNFLGGQWANESWGRYWGWDPKETWALISIMVYALVLHLRLVPALKGRWLFNFMAMVAYASIIMTYFGVNFYLTGLHSYANGDSPVTPSFVWYSLAFIIIIGSGSFMKHKKFG